MLQPVLGGLTITLLVVSFSASNSFAGPLEDSLTMPAERDACMKEFVPLRQEAEARGKLIRAASARRAPAAEACELIGNFGRSEIRMIQYVDANATRCGIPPQTAERLRAGHQNTEAMQNKVCTVAQQEQWRGPAGPVGDFDDIGAPPLVR
jgi:hypothetical protein